MNSQGLRSALAGLLATVICVLPGTTGTAAAAPPAGNISKNVTFVANIPEMKEAISIAFIDETMFVSTVHGLYAYSVADPSAPSLLGALPMYIWENEDMTVDATRNLVYISRDPRGFTSPVTPGVFPYGAVHIVDVSIPHAMTIVNTIPVPAGHTTTCINSCHFIWTGGPVAGVQQPGDWGGRPIFATDVTDPMNPVACPDPIDVGRNDGVTDYAHDVQVDEAGVAWVSGAGGVRGYWTSGKHRNPLTGKTEEATGCKPIPYAGGGTPESATPSRFMHNSWRNINASIGGKKGAVLYGTEENVTSDCRTSGRFTTYDLRGSYNGEGWKNIDKTHFRMKALDTFTPEGQRGSEGCDSAHYFADRGDELLAGAYYSAGTRFLDVSNPKDIRQIGYYVPSDANVWAAYWHDGLVYIADNARGVDIVKFKGGSSARAVTAPVSTNVQPLDFSARGHFMCPLPQRAPASR
jgi:hypothetical protein